MSITQRTVERSRDGSGKPRKEQQMVFGPSRLDGPERPSPFGETGARVQVPGGFPLQRASAIQGAPPPEVLDALDNAARVLEELASRRLSLHFAYNDTIDQVRVQLTNEHGKVVREIPPSTLLDIAAGVQQQAA
jgi:FlaG protein